MRIDTHGGRGLIPIGAELFRENKNHLGAAGTATRRTLNGYPYDPLTLSLTDAAADVLREYAATQRWRLVAQYDTEAHGMTVPVEVVAISFPCRDGRAVRTPA